MRTFYIFHENMFTADITHLEKVVYRKVIDAAKVHEMQCILLNREYIGSSFISLIDCSILCIKFTNDA